MRDGLAWHVQERDGLSTIPSFELILGSAVGQDQADSCQCVFAARYGREIRVSYIVRTLFPNPCGVEEEEYVIATHGKPTAVRFLRTVF